jgi:hypothetical protein
MIYLTSLSRLSTIFLSVLMDQALVHWVEVGLLVVGILGYAIDRRRDGRERMADRDHQVQMHTENRLRLESLTNLQQENGKATAFLSNQTATLAEMAKGLDRRLQMIEDRATR